MISAATGAIALLMVSLVKDHGLQYTHSPLCKLLWGSKTTELLRAARVPTLLLR